MAASNLECLRTYEELQSIQKELEEFTQRFFPGSYARSHAWLSAYWSAYCHGQPALIYLQRGAPNGNLSAVAPLLIRKENFGGFPVHCLQMLGAGIGREEILADGQSDGFLREVFSELRRDHRWDIARFRRIRNTSLLHNLKTLCSQVPLRFDSVVSEDLIVDLPKDYATFLKSKNSKFRSNIKLGEAKIEKVGKLSYASYELSDARVSMESLHDNVAANSWQYQEGSSHFNDNGSGCMYANLRRRLSDAQAQKCIVSFLSIGDRPAAYVVDVIVGDTCYCVDTAFDGRLTNLSLGRIVFNKTIEDLIQRGVKEFDLEGGGEYKLLYANRTAAAEDLIIYNNTIYGKLLALARNSANYRHIRDFVKRHVSTMNKTIQSSKL